MEVRKMRLRCNVDRTSFGTKPGPEQIERIQCNLEKPQEIEAEELFQIICSGGSFRPAAVEGKSDKGFVSQQIFAVDLDNATGKKPVPENDRLTPEQAVERARAAGLKPNLVYPTFSDSPALRKFRVLFVMDRPVTDRLLRDRLADYVVNIFGAAADSKCRNPARLFFGTNKPPILTDVENVNRVDELMPLLPDEPPRVKKKRTKAAVKKKPEEVAGRKSNIDLIRERNWGELAGRVGNRERKIFDNLADFKNEVWREVDLAELLEIDNPKTFCCIFHEDKHPSASIYFGDCEKWLYKCHASGCSCAGRAMTVNSIISRLAGTTAGETWEAIKQIYNYEILRTPQSEALQRELQEISEILDTTDETGFCAQCPVASKNVRYALGIYHHILRIAGRNISPYAADDQIIFFFSNRQLAVEAGRSPNKANKVNQYVTMLAYHGLIEKLPDGKVPMNLLKKAYENARAGQRHVQFYAIQGWPDTKLPEIEENGVRWRKNGYRQGGISYEMFYRTEGPEVARRLYPLTCQKTIEKKIMTRKPTEAAEARHDEIRELCLDMIRKDGYATEQGIVERLQKKGISGELSDRQLKRSIADICNAANLKKVRATKELKEKFSIVSNGYPAIIIEE